MFLRICLLHLLFFFYLFARNPEDKVGYNLPQLPTNQQNGQSLNQIGTNENSKASSTSNVNSSDNSPPSSNKENTADTQSDRKSEKAKDTVNNDKTGTVNNQSKVIPDKTSKEEITPFTTNDKEKEKEKEKTTTSISNESKPSSTITVISNKNKTKTDGNSNNPVIRCLVESGCGTDTKCLARCAKVPNPSADAVMRTSACMGRCNTTEHPLPPPGSDYAATLRTTQCYEKCVKGIYMDHGKKGLKRDVGTTQTESWANIKDLEIWIMVFLGIILFATI